MKAYAMAYILTKSWNADTNRGPPLTAESIKHILNDCGSLNDSNEFSFAGILD